LQGYFDLILIILIFGDIQKTELQHLKHA